MEETIETVTQEGLGLMDIVIGAFLPFVPYTQSYGFWGWAHTVGALHHCALVFHAGAPQEYGLHANAPRC